MYIFKNKYFYSLSSWRYCLREKNIDYDFQVRLKMDKRRDRRQKVKLIALKTSRSDPIVQSLLQMAKHDLVTVKKKKKNSPKLLG